MASFVDTWRFALKAQAEREQQKTDIFNTLRENEMKARKEQREIESADRERKQTDFDNSVRRIELLNQTAVGASRYYDSLVQSGMTPEDALMKTQPLYEQGVETMGSSGIDVSKFPKTFNPEGAKAGAMMTTKIKVQLEDARKKLGLKETERHHRVMEGAKSSIDKIGGTKEQIMALIAEGKPLTSGQKRVLGMITKKEEKLFDDAIGILKNNFNFKNADRDTRKRMIEEQLEDIHTLFKKWGGGGSGASPAGEAREALSEQGKQATPTTTDTTPLSQKDIEYTAEKYGITVEEVKRKLGIE